MTDTKTQLPKKTRTWTVQLLDAQGNITHQETMQGNEKKAKSLVRKAEKKMLKKRHSVG